LLLKDLLTKGVIYFDSAKVHWFLYEGIVISNAIFLHVYWSVENEGPFHLPHGGHDFFAAFVPLTDLGL